MENNRNGYVQEQIAPRSLMQERFWDEYAEYIAITPMTVNERRLLRKWVSEGHSVNESPGSKYLPDRYPPTDFLETYREDCEITRATIGMTDDEAEAYLKEYTGSEAPDSEQKAYIDVNESGTKSVKKYIKNIQREMWHLWEFVWQEGLGEEARAFIEEHKDEESLFEWSL